jgi:hypothetical protein
MRLKELIAKLEEQEKNIAVVIVQSESMLKGATVAGLASSFQDARRALDDQLF